MNSKIGPGANLITYVDDLCVVVRAKATEDLVNLMKTTMERHLQWLKTNGMVCNVDKTEMIVMGGDSITIDVDGREINSRYKMKVLGIIFGTQLDWKFQMASTIQRTKWTLFGLKKIHKYLSRKQAKMVVTSCYFPDALLRDGSLESPPLSIRPEAETKKCTLQSPQSDLW